MGECYLNKETAYNTDLLSGPIPTIDGGTHRITIDGNISTPLSLALSDLQLLPQHSIVAALQCAGNRRHTMRTQIKEVEGIDWFDGAVMNCKWTGPRLRDVLMKAGLDVEEGRWSQAHVAFACYQAPCEDDSWYGASIPLERAMKEDADVLLALKMNDETLTSNHGYPVRVVVPGIAGARSVKWLERITVQMTESNNHYQQFDYKVLPPDVKSVEDAEGAWGKVPALQDMPINSAIGIPLAGSTVKRDADGLVEVKGYALPGCDTGPVVRVEISADGGTNWQDATLLENEADVGDESGGKWAWCIWEAKIGMQKGAGQRLLSRATDKGGQVQSEAKSQWNLRGVIYHGFGEAGDLEIV